MSVTVTKTFSKPEKLKSRKQIDLLFREGKSFFAAPVKCYFKLKGNQVDGLKGLKVDKLGEEGEGVDVTAEHLIGLKNDSRDLLDEIQNLNANQTPPTPPSNPQLQTSNLKPQTSNLKPQTQNLKPQTSNLKPQTPNIKHQTSNLKPKTSNLKPQTSNIQIGVSVSKKQFKKAVDRNRVKRLLREAYRLHKIKLKEKLNETHLSLEVFFVFTDRTLPTFALVEEKIKYCLRRLVKIVEGGS